MEKLRTWKVTWKEDYSIYFRWFKSKKQAENWIWSQLIDKRICLACEININQERR